MTASSKRLMEEIMPQVCVRVNLFDSTTPILIRLALRRLSAVMISSCERSHATS